MKPSRASFERVGGCGCTPSFVFYKELAESNKLFRIESKRS